MAPVKFDDNIRRKLEERTLRPSEDAWNILEGKLDNQIKVSNSQWVWWLGIAATLVGVFLAVTIFYKKESSLQPTVVELPKEEQVSPVKEKLKEQLVTFEETVEEVDEGNNDPSQTSQEVNKANPFKPQKSIKNKYASNLEESDQNGLGNSKENQKQEPLMETIAQYEVKSDEIQLSPEAEVEWLLQKAQHNLELKQHLKEQRVVDAKSLLESVEADMEDSFKDRVFETLKSGYFTLKEAVAERNH